MPAIRYRFTSQANREFGRLPTRVQQRIVSALDRHMADPRVGNVSKLAGGGDEWRFRVGDWRLRFRYSADGQEMIILRVLPRDQAYRE